MVTLITGASGFLGNHILSKLSKDVLAPTSKDLNLLDCGAVDAFFEMHRPNKVLHMAAICGGIKANQNSPADFTFLNSQMAINIFAAIRKYDTEYVYTLGSVCSYPQFCPTPFKEDDIWNGYPEPTNAGYGFSKKLLLMLQQTHRQQYGLKGAHLIPVNMYGEHDHFDLTNSHVIPALIRRFLDAVQNKASEVRCWGTGNATREFLYAGDCAEALYRVLKTNFDTPLPINLGTGYSISIYDLAHLIARLTGYNGNIVFTGEVSDGQPKRQLDVTRAQDLLGFTAKTTLMKGLINTICWYQDNRHLIKD